MPPYNIDPATGGPLESFYNPPEPNPDRYTQPEPAPRQLDLNKLEGALGKVTHVLSSMRPDEYEWIRLALDTVLRTTRETTRLPDGHTGFTPKGIPNEPTPVVADHVDTTDTIDEEVGPDPDKPKRGRPRKSHTTDD